MGLVLQTYQWMSPTPARDGDLEHQQERPFAVAHSIERKAA